VLSEEPALRRVGFLFFSFFHGREGELLAHQLADTYQPIFFRGRGGESGKHE
jgi:hypothetical protein